MKNPIAVLALGSAVMVASSTGFAADTPEFKIAIKDHRFNPAELTIPTETKVKLIVDNQDATPEEFESHELNREKVIPGNSKATIFVGPLNAGTYPFFGDFNQTSAQGKLIVK